MRTVTYRGWPHRTDQAAWTRRPTLGSESLTTPHRAHGDACGEEGSLCGRKPRRVLRSLPPSTCALASLAALHASPPRAARQQLAAAAESQRGKQRICNLGSGLLTPDGSDEMVEHRRVLPRTS